MANDTLPMSEMFSACHEVLQREMRPLRYTELTEMALGDLGLSKADVCWRRQIEDVREKMLLAGQYDSFYVGAPHCLGGLRWWFRNGQLRLLHPTPGIVIPGNATWGAAGAHEALRRDPYLKIKSSVPREKIAWARARGFVLEKHVAGWFKENWPDFYLPPENEREWRRGSNHDFKLRVDGRVFKVDVSGPRQDGQFGNPGQGKRRADFHLICEIVGRDVLWKSVFAGGDYGRVIFPDFTGIWPERMAVWLNCKRDGIDYEAIAGALEQSNQQSNVR
jgi:hypothetical protein